MSGKLIYILLGLILLVIAAEGGYYWGIRTAKNQNSRTQGPGDINPLQNVTDSSSPGAIIPVTDGVAREWVKTVNDLPIDSLWTSAWDSSIGGKFVGKDKTSVIIDTSKGRKKIEYPVGSTITYDLYDEMKDEHTPLSETDIQEGDNVTVFVSISTIDGTVHYASLSKIINRYPTPILTPNLTN